MKFIAKHWGKISKRLSYFFIPLSLICLFFSAFPAQSQSGGGDSAQQSKAQLKKILAQKEFHPEAATNPFEQGFRWVQEQWDKVSKWIKDVWDSITKSLGSAGQGFGSFAQVLVYVVMAALLIALVMFLVGQFYRFRSGETQARKRTVFDAAEDDDDNFSRDPEEWLTQAKTVCESGEFRKAYRAVFIAILLNLDIAVMIEFNKSNTNGDYLNQLKSNDRSRLNAMLAPLVLDFDKKWYGGIETTREDYLQILHSHDLISEQIEQESLPINQSQTLPGVFGEAS